MFERLEEERRTWLEEEDVDVALERVRRCWMGTAAGR